MKCYVKATCRYFGFNFFSACFSLPWFDREIAMISCSARNIAKPFLSQRFDLCQFHMTCNHHNRRSEEHTSELQSRENLVCRLLLEKKKRERTTMKY